MIRPRSVGKRREAQGSAGKRMEAQGVEGKRREALGRKRQQSKAAVKIRKKQRGDEMRTAEVKRSHWKRGTRNCRVPVICKGKSDVERI
jgi:hypothetical protein